MKKTHEQLEKMIEKITEKIEEREIIFDERSEKWQESEKGEMFQVKTDCLQDVLSDLENAFERFGEYFE